MSFNFSGAQKPATGFTLPTTNATPTTAASTGFQLNAGSGEPSKSLSQPKPSVPNLFGTPPTSAGINFSSPKVATPNLSFGAPVTSTTSNLNLGGTPGVVPQMGFGTPAPGAAPSLTSAAATPAAASTPPQFGFGSALSSSASKTSFTPIAATAAPTASIAPTSAAAPKLSFGLPTPAVSSAAPTLSALPLGGASLIPASTTATTPAVASTIAAPTGSLTFAQLEDNINKWTIDLEEQGKFFINQAKQLNAWDMLLISNGDKILNLNNSIERVKQEQTQLDQELDFIKAQQKELEELISPLEKELVDIPVSDIDRNQMYQYSEIIDSQLKQMSEDLKEIIEHINESHKGEELSNPVTQISKILNAHMNSLQWIDINTVQISSHLEHISKLQDSNRRNMSLNKSFNM